jgi:hypothetical protein
VTRTKRLSQTPLLTTVMLLLVSLPLSAQTIGWEANFDDGTANGGIMLFVKRSTGADNSCLISRFEDGALVLGGKFDQESLSGSGDYASVEFRNINIDITKNPMLEIRCKLPKNGNIAVFPTYEFKDGTRNTPYSIYTPTADGDWQTIVIRPSAESSLPREWTPRRIITLELWLQASTPEPMEMKLDNIRFRTFTPGEKSLDDNWVKLMRDYVPPQQPVLHRFFPFGVYADSSSDGSEHSLTQEHSLSVLTRNHLNFVLAGAPLAARGRKYSPSELTSPYVEAAQAAGVKTFVRMREAPSLYATKGEDETRTWIRDFVTCTKNSPAVLGYDVGDEPSADQLWQMVAAKKLIEQADPAGIVGTCFWDINSIRAFNPYFQVAISDHYPLAIDKTTDPKDVFDWCRQVARVTGNRRHWVILQSFGMAEWKSTEGYRFPTPAELRLMTYEAIAGGARGIIYFAYNAVPEKFKMMADPWGNPNPLFKETGALARKLIPVCGRLLDCVVDSDSQVLSTNPQILTGALFDPGRKVRYLVAVNTNLKTSQMSKLTLPQAWAKLDAHIWDMDLPGKASDSPEKLTVAPLRPGEGAIYLCGTREEFERDRKAVLTKRIEEELRIQTLDMSIAKRYKADLTGVNQLRAKAVTLSAKGKYDEAMQVAVKATAALGKVMRGIKPYWTAKTRLDAVAGRLGKVERLMYDTGLKSRFDMSELRGQYWSIYEPWRQAYARTISGKGKGLDGDIADIEERAAAVVKAIHEEVRE